MPQALRSAHLSPRTTVMGLPYTDGVCFKGAKGTQVEKHIIQPCSTGEASRSSKELNVSKMRAGESVMRRMGAVGYATKVSMSMRNCHTRMIDGYLTYQQNRSIWNKQGMTGRGGRHLSRLRASTKCVASTGPSSRSLSPTIA